LALDFTTNNPSETDTLVNSPIAQARLAYDYLPVDIKFVSSI